MRLWHKDLIQYLPKSQLWLLGQWRELNSIYANENKHILINYAYEYHEDHLYVYSLYVIKEMTKRHYKINQWQNFYKYFKMPFKYSIQDLTYNMEEKIIPFPNHHNEEYLKICCWNLYEKYLRGQEGFTDETIKFIKEKL